MSTPTVTGDDNWRQSYTPHEIRTIEAFVPGGTDKDCLKLIISMIPLVEVDGEIDYVKSLHLFEEEMLSMRRFQNPPEPEPNIRDYKSIAQCDSYEKWLIYSEGYYQYHPEWKVGRKLPEKRRLFESKRAVVRSG